MSDDTSGSADGASGPTTLRAEDAKRVLGVDTLGDRTLYQQALTHRSRFQGTDDAHLRSNERLEFLGDALLDVIVGEALYRRFPEQDEGYLTRLRAKLVSGQALAQTARRLGLGDLLLLSENAERSGGRDNAGILADAYEAVVAALYLDQGLDAARRFVHRSALDPIDLSDVATQATDYKSRLQEHLQAAGAPLPTYRVTDEVGPSHDKTFTVEVRVDDTPRGAGRGSSKKAAEQHAAREALQRLRTSSNGSSPP
jgi:ribonuclease-3